MKPIRLEFDGIKSYTNRTIIDFRKLTTEGIFGIFGNTGSGKSTILDCILLSLFGKLTKTNRATDFLNFNAQNGYVDFTFSMKSDGVDKVYNVRHDFKLKQDRTPAGHKALLVEIIDDVKIPLAEGADRVKEKIEEIIGLKIDDFEKCIILPQGEFAAFVGLQKAKRLAMMSSLFNLDKYGEGLKRKVNSKLKALEIEIKGREMSLRTYDEDTKDKLDELSKEIELTKEEKITLGIKFSKISDIYLKNEKNYDTHKKLLNLNNHLEKLKKLHPLMEERKTSIDRFNLVIQAKDLFSKIKKIEQDLLSENNSLNGLYKLQKHLDERFENLFIRKKELENFENELSQIDATLLLLDDISEDIIDNKKREVALDRLRKEIVELKTQKSNLLSDNEKIVSEIEKEKLDLEKLEIKQHISALLVDIENSSNNEFFISEIDFLKSLLSLTQNLASEMILERIDFIKSKFDNTCSTDMRSSLEKLSSLYEENDKRTKRIQNLENKNIQITAQIENIEYQISSISLEGKKLREEYDKFQERIDKNLLGKNYDDYKNQLVLRKNRLVSLKTELIDLEKTLLSEKTDISSKIAGCNAKIEELTKQLNLANKEYHDIVSKNFRDEGEINKIYRLLGDNLEVIVSETEKYFNELYSTDSQIKELSKEIEENEFSLENYEKVKLEYENLEKKVKEVDNILYNLNKTYKNKSLNFEKRCIIESEKSQFEKEYSLNSQLSSALSNNGLLEFVCDEYLKEIAQIAKVTLLTLTDGRFGLRYNGDFLVEDNVLGGQVRIVDTVSGGELFLVSLSLALALSRSIYSKSQKPIEFFFLDEGFGSLDKDLIETVMDCLNKLKDEHLTIGVISHVEGLKERINAKILVSPASEISGSTLTVI